LLHRHYPASTLVRACPPPQVARPVPRGRPVGSHALPPPRVSRVASDPLRRHAVAITPVGSLDQIVRNEGLSTPRDSPATAAFPVSVAGRLPHYPFRGLLSVHSRYGLPARGVAKRPFSSKAPTVSLPPPPLRLLPAGTTRVAGRELHPLRIDTFPRRTQKVGLSPADSAFRYQTDKDRRASEPVASRVRDLHGKTHPERYPHGATSWEGRGSHITIGLRRGAPGRCTTAVA
jgi:hypothetical protein